MAKKTNDKSILEMQVLIWDKVAELREKRKRAFDTHKENRAKTFPYESEMARELSEGSPAAANIADQIMYLIETGKMLGLIEGKVNYVDYLYLHVSFSKPQRVSYSEGYFSDRSVS